MKDGVFTAQQKGRVPGGNAAFGGEWRAAYAADSQYPALNGLLMRNASGDTSSSLSVGIFSPSTRVSAVTLSWGLASLARSAWPACAERATEKNRST